jgi:hypothetical protein
VQVYNQTVRPVTENKQNRERERERERDYISIIKQLEQKIRLLKSHPLRSWAARKF